ncbi:helix-turn-helix domain-containing protein [Flavobacterium sp. F372]|uniref:Helix-turn-helix domain-containing protein n=2 Tax=Flavobacterium bernardetii TaxID=2813823 RepID=A0ABR7IX44_9FLAO|nr:helix-turn-helix domain-containing protein [Flavobacterium bernardetii]MBC5834340.1 helix-turn-helix domain-containing protein [Flavobacterium bernardetii]NHF70021.1 helix-turn-helix domain-containing protein [Flavobacterium bernardetii]
MLKSELLEEISHEEIRTKLKSIEQLLTAQSLTNKSIFNIDEVATYTGLSKLYLYKLTSKNDIPHYKPNGKNIFFNKAEIDNWLLRNRQSTNEEINAEAINYSVNKIKASL